MSARKNASPHERAIARALAVTDAGLEVLLRASGTPEGRAYGRGFGQSAGGARERLQRQGYLTAEHILTDAGREIVHRARAMGY